MILNSFESVGIDGCKGKWAVVAISKDKFEVTLHENIASICEQYSSAGSIIIDMPIGLPESTEDIRPDSKLRKILKCKASSVFNTPCRQAIHAADDTQAIAENKKVLGLSMSKQSLAILPKIREIDTFLQDNPDWKNRLMESHPEYCFALLNQNKPVCESKREKTGKEERLRLLSKYYAESREVVEQFQKSFPRLVSKTDDVIDALVLAVIGALGLQSEFITVPDKPMKDAKGLYMQIKGIKIPEKNVLLFDE